MVVAAPLPRRTLRRLARRAETVEARLAGLGAFAMLTTTVLWHALVDVIGKLRFRRLLLRHTSDIGAGAGAGEVGGGVVCGGGAMADGTHVVWGEGGGRERKLQWRAWVQ